MAKQSKAGRPSSLPKKLQEAMNEQIKNEFASAYLYLAMSAYCESLSLPGMARWLRIQAEEEIEHGMKFYHFIIDRGGRVVLKAIEQPPADFASPLDVFEHAYQHERQVSEMINDLYRLALEECDYSSQAFLHWFLEEQVEEEKITSQAADMLRLAGDRGEALLLVDRELGSRREEDSP